MTTIAWDGKTLAGDKLTSMGGTPIVSTKVHAVKNTHGIVEYLVGCAGLAADCQAFVRWVEGGFVTERPNFQDVNALLIHDDGRIDHYTEMENVHHVGKLSYWAEGSGANYALGALAHGATAEEAIRIATQLDIHTGLGVDTVTF